MAGYLNPNQARNICRMKNAEDGGRMPHLALSNLGEQREDQEQQPAEQEQVADTRMEAEAVRERVCLMGADPPRQPHKKRRSRQRRSAG